MPKPPPKAGADAPKPGVCPNAGALLWPKAGAVPPKAGVAPPKAGVPLPKPVEPKGGACEAPNAGAGLWPNAGALAAPKPDAGVPNGCGDCAPKPPEDWPKAPLVGEAPVLPFTPACGCQNRSEDSCNCQTIGCQPSMHGMETCQQCIKAYKLDAEHVSCRKKCIVSVS